jgi:hypothetical protein
MYSSVLNTRGARCKFVDNFPPLETVGGAHATNFHPVSSAVVILLFPLRPGLPDSILGTAVYRLNKKEKRRQLRGAVSAEPQGTRNEDVSLAA